MSENQRKSLARALRHAREDRGWSQAQLAAKLGLPPASVSHFETGLRLPSLPNLRKLCIALNRSADEMLGI